MAPFPVLAAGVAGVALTAGASTGVSALPSRTDPALTALITKAAADLGPNYKNGCHRGLDDVDQPDCRFGQLGGPRVVLFGDSHAAQWFTAVVKAGEETGWEVNAWTKTSCPSVDVTMWYMPSRSVYLACDEWRKGRLSDLNENPPDLVILTNFGRYRGIYDATRRGVADRATAQALWEAGSRRTVETLIAAGIPVVELRDTPRMYTSYKDCLSNGQWDACGRPRSEALAGKTSAQIGHDLYWQLDLSDLLCSPNTCSSVIDGAIAYRDSHHLTASHAASLYEHFAALLGGNEKWIPAAPPTQREPSIE